MDDRTAKRVVSGHCMRDKLYSVLFLFHKNSVPKIEIKNDPSGSQGGGVEDGAFAPAAGEDPACRILFYVRGLSLQNSVADYTLATFGAAWYR